MTDTPTEVQPVEAQPADTTPVEAIPAPLPRGHSRTVTWLRRASWVFMGTAVLLIGYVGLLIGYESYQQHRLSSLFAERVPAATVHDVKFTSATLPIQRPHLADGEPIAKVELPKVHFDAIVTEGSDSGILSSGPGHDDHTGYPGEGRLIVIGNHNGFSGSWGDMQVGDPIVVTMSYGRFHYTVTKREIVPGDDTSVVAKHFSDGETLVLSTCWPLWQGAFARERLVFEATPAVSS